MSRVVTNLKVLTLTRTQTLYRVVTEIIEGVTGTSAPDTIRKGVLDAPLLEAIVIYVVNGNREIIATVELNIDWRKHEVYSSTKGMKDMVFQEGMSVAAQISKAIRDIAKFVSDIRAETKNVKTEVWYRVRTDGPISESAARTKLGFPAGGSKQLEWSKGKYIRGSLQPKDLDELSIRFRTKVE